MTHIDVINSDLFEGETLEENCKVIETISETQCIVELSSDNSIKCIVDLIDGVWVILENIE